MNKEDNFKEKFKQALISTAKVISDDYRPNTSKQNVSSNNFNFFELYNLNSRHDFIRLRAETDSEALKKKFCNKKIYQKIQLVDFCMIFQKKSDMNYWVRKCLKEYPKT